MWWRNRKGTKILIGSLATCLPKLPHEPKLAGSQRCQATLCEKNILAAEGRKTKGQNGKLLCLNNTKQRPAAVLKKLKNVQSGAKHRTQYCGHTRRALWEGATTRACFPVPAKHCLWSESLPTTQHKVSFVFKSQVPKSKSLICGRMIVTSLKMWFMCNEDFLNWSPSSYCILLRNAFVHLQQDMKAEPYKLSCYMKK